MSDNLGGNFDFYDEYLFAFDWNNWNHLIIINLETKEITTKENILDGISIDFIKTSKIDECVVIASDFFN